MNHFVPQEEDDDLMELLWQNGQVVLQNQRLQKPPSSSSVKLHGGGGGEAAPPPPLQQQQPLDQHLFIQEDEMTSWLQYPLRDRDRDGDFCSDLLFSASAAPPPTAPPPVRNFANFSRIRGRESAQVSPSAAPDGSDVAGKGKAVAADYCKIPTTSSSKTIVHDTKRKEREAVDESECRSEETKQGRGSTSTKRSRAAQVHNLSERKRRDRINERMKALQELIPRCNKSDKASMLDEAIEYMKSLQLQIQMMSMGCGMMPMMYTGMQKYMPHMAMGMGMNQPLPSLVPFPNMLAAQRPLPTQSHMGGGSVFSGPHHPVHASDPSRVYVPNLQCDPSSSQPQYPDYMDPYQRFRSLHPTQPPEFQNQATSYPSSSRVSSSKESEDQGNRTTG